MKRYLFIINHYYSLLFICVLISTAKVALDFLKKAVFAAITQSQHERKPKPPPMAALAGLPAAEGGGLSARPQSGGDVQGEEEGALYARFERVRVSPLPSTKAFSSHPRSSSLVVSLTSSPAAYLQGMVGRG